MLDNSIGSRPNTQIDNHQLELRLKGSTVFVAGEWLAQITNPSLKISLTDVRLILQKYLLN